MTGQKKKKRLPIPAAALAVLLLAVLLSAVFLSGCASSKYQAIEIEGIGTEAVSQEEKEKAGGEQDVALETEAGETLEAGEPDPRGCRSAGSGPERGFGLAGTSGSVCERGFGLAGASGNVRERGSCRAASRRAGGRRDVFQRPYRGHRRRAPGEGERGERAHRPFFGNYEGKDAGGSRGNGSWRLRSMN